MGIFSIWAAWSIIKIINRDWIQVNSTCPLCKESILKKYNLENMHDIDINQNKFIVEKEDYT